MKKTKNTHTEIIWDGGWGCGTCHVKVQSDYVSYLVVAKESRAFRHLYQYDERTTQLVSARKARAHTHVCGGGELERRSDAVTVRRPDESAPPTSPCESV